jgi:hypothetical protein
MEIYRKFEQPPAWALKEIQAGRLKGKSDINPQWRIEALTELFGICGIGWYFEIQNQWTEVGGNNEKAAFVNIHLFIKQNNEWSKPIPGTGGSSFVANEKNGLYTSDECYKMALTDALSVACKMLGIASKIYNGTKYDAKQEQINKPVNTKLWLNPNTPQWNDAIKYLKEGHKIEEIEKKYSISLVNREKLISEAI